MDTISRGNELPIGDTNRWMAYCRGRLVASLSVLPLLLLSLVVTGCGDDDDDASLASAGNDAPLVSAVIVAADGGAVAVPASNPAAGTSITIPAGALAADATIRINSVITSSVAGAVGFQVDIGPSGTQFDPPATVTIPYDTALLPAGTDESAMVIVVVAAGGTLTPLANIAVDTTAHTISGATTHLSNFVPVAPVVGAITLTASPAAIAAGGVAAATLTVTVTNQIDSQAMPDGTAVAFTTTLGDLTTASTTTTAGSATTQLTGVTAGTARLTATAGGVTSNTVEVVLTVVAEDTCPDDPAKMAPGVCGCGVADTDTDGDGTADCNDGCVDDPAKTARGTCGCDTPDTDTDTDGIPDCVDGCFNDETKIAPGICGCGTPDAGDADGDGVLDCVDLCPGFDDTVDTDSDGIPDGCETGGGTTVSGQALLGPIVGATVEIYDVANLAAGPLVTTTTTTSGDLSLAGLIDIDPATFNDVAFYLVVVSNGEDIDHDDDGVVDTTPTPLVGEVHALIQGAQLKGGGWKVSAVTEAAYRSARYLVQADYGSAAIVDSLDTSAAELLTADLNGDGTIDRRDLAVWHPVTNAGVERLPAATRSILVDEITSGTPVRNLAQEARHSIGTVAGLGFASGIHVVGTTAYVVVGGPCDFYIYDVADPRNPVEVGMTSVADGQCDFLSEVAVVGNTAFAVGDGLHVIDITDPANPAVIGSHYTLPAGAPEFGDITSNVIGVRGNTLFISAFGHWGPGGHLSGGALMAVDISDPANPTVQGKFFPSDRNAGGLALKIRGDHAYLFLSELVNEPVIDISNPAAMSQIGSVSLAPSSGDPNAAAIDGDYLYVLLSQQGVSVFDITAPTTPVQVGALTSPTPSSSFLNIAVADGHAYLPTDGRLHVADVTDPAHPQLIASLSVADTLSLQRGFEVVGGLAYLGGDNGIEVVDVVDPAVRGILGSVTLPGSQGQLPEVALNGAHAYVTAGGLHVVDLTDPTTPTVVGNVPAAELGGAALAPVAAGNYLFTGGNGVYAVDVSDPTTPVVVDSHPEYPAALALALRSAPYLYAGYFLSGVGHMQVLDYSGLPANPLSPQGELVDVTGAIAVGPGGFGKDRLYYLAEPSLKVAEVDTTTGAVSAPSLGSHAFADGSRLEGLALTRDIALVMADKGGARRLHALGISNPADIQPLDALDTFFATDLGRTQVAASENTAVVSDGDAGLLVVDLAVDGTLTPTALIPLGGLAWDVAVSDNLAAVTTGNLLLPGDATLQIIKLPVQSYTVGGTVQGLSGTVVIQNNDDDDLTVTTDGSFTFSTPLPDGTFYRVTVLTQPVDQHCDVQNGAGSLNGTDFIGAGVLCFDNPSGTFIVGGTVSGMIGSGLALQINGGENLLIDANGAFTFPAGLAGGAGYTVTIVPGTEPSGEQCEVTNGTGTIQGADVTDVSVTCFGV